MTFTLRFIRHDDAMDSGNARNDDLAVIRCVGPDTYTLTYRCTNASSPVITTHTLTDRAVFQWMRSVIGLLELDGDPFANLQVSMTGFPDVLLRVSTRGSGDNVKYHIGRAYNRLLDLTEFFLNNTTPPPPPREATWDDDDSTTISDTGASPYVRTHTFFA